MINLKLFIFTRNSSAQIPTNTNMVSAKSITRRYAKIIVDSVLVDNRTFDWKVALLKRIIADDRMK